MIGGSVICCLSAVSKDVSSEAAGLIVTKFYVEPPGLMGKILFKLTWSRRKSTDQMVLVI